MKKSNILIVSSITTLQLSILPLAFDTVQAAVCPGDSFNFNGQIIYSAGNYNHISTAANGCDSTTTLLLSILPLTYDTVAVAICEGDSFEFNGQTIDIAGAYTYTTAGSNGCDSTTTLYLDVLSHAFTEVSASICPNDTLYFNGQILTEPGTYYHVEASSIGCDSTVTLTLDELSTSSGSSEQHMCQGEKITFGSQSITEAGSYIEVFNAANGCDSTHHLTVTSSSIESKVGIFGDTLKSIFPAHIYEWVKCPSYSLTGIYTPYFIPGDYQFYALVAYDTNGCSDTSWCFKVSPNGLEGDAEAAFTPYPNPASDWIQIDNRSGEQAAEWYDALGRLVLIGISANGLLETPETTGVYMLMLQSSTQTSYHKVIVNRP
jgi:hypothetical protein